MNRLSMIMCHIRIDDYTTFNMVMHDLYSFRVWSIRICDINVVVKPSLCVSRSSHSAFVCACVCVVWLWLGTEAHVEQKQQETHISSANFEAHISNDWYAHKCDTHHISFDSHFYLEYHTCSIPMYICTMSRFIVVTHLMNMQSVCVRTYGNVWNASNKHMRIYLNAQYRDCFVCTSFRAATFSSWCLLFTGRDNFLLREVGILYSTQTERNLQNLLRWMRERLDCDKNNGFALFNSREKWIFPEKSFAVHECCTHSRNMMCKWGEIVWTIQQNWLLWQYFASRTDELCFVMLNILFI